MSYACGKLVRKGTLIAAAAIALWGLGATSAHALQPAGQGPVAQPTGQGPVAQPAGQGPARSTVTAEQQAALTRATEQARRGVASATSARDRGRSDKARLAGEYEAQLAELDQLKKRQASWRRDRAIREHMSRSHGTARKLAASDEKLRRLEAQLVKARRELVVAIDRELAGNPSRARRADLLSWRGASRTPGRGARKIVLPDDTIDPLADPEELDYQASLIRQGEEQLARELDKLDKQSERYLRMADLQKNRQRAAAHGQLDDDRPRRTAGNPSGRFGEADTAAGAGPSPTSPGENTPPTDQPNGPPNVPDDGTNGSPLEAGGDDGNFDVVLADVVDGSTVDALRAAELSTDPAVKARAAKRAREQVKARLEELRARRKEIQKRATTLRKE